MSLTMKPEVINRSEKDFIYIEKQGDFKETAPASWREIFPLTNGHIEKNKIQGCVALSNIQKDSKGDELMIYQAGFEVTEKPTIIPKGTTYRKIPGGKFARFVLKGPYTEINHAFHVVMDVLEKEHYELRSDFCIENYLNDPTDTPEDQLLTEILVPIQ